MSNKSSFQCTCPVCKSKFTPEDGKVQEAGDCPSNIHKNEYPIYIEIGENLKEAVRLAGERGATIEITNVVQDVFFRFK